MKKLMILAGAMTLIFSVSCDQLLKAKKTSDQKQEYSFERCVEIMMQMSGPNPDDGDRWDAEMSCAPCQMGGYHACKKLIDDLTGEGEYGKEKGHDEYE